MTIIANIKWLDSQRHVTADGHEIEPESKKSCGGLELLPNNIKPHENTNNRVNNTKEIRYSMLFPVRMKF